MAHSHPFFVIAAASRHGAKPLCHGEQSRTICPYCHPDRSCICHPDRSRHVIPTERSEWRDLLHCLTFHRKRNGKPLMLTKTHSLPFPFLFLCHGERRTKSEAEPSALLDCRFLHSLRSVGMTKVRRLLPTCQSVRKDKFA